jgi:hypothetical protein
MIASPSDIAWAAGLFEGEGCIYFRSNASRIRNQGVTVAMTDLDVLKKFNSVVGVGKIYNSYAARTNRKALYQWRTDKFENVQYVIALFWKHLCSRRRSSAIKALTMMKELRAGMSTRQKSMYFARRLNESCP